MPLISDNPVDQACLDPPSTILQNAAVPKLHNVKPAQTIECTMSSTRFPPSGVAMLQRSVTDPHHQVSPSVPRTPVPVLRKAFERQIHTEEQPLASAGRKPSGKAFTSKWAKKDTQRSLTIPELSESLKSKDRQIVEFEREKRRLEKEVEYQKQELIYRTTMLAQIRDENSKMKAESCCYSSSRISRFMSSTSSRLCDVDERNHFTQIVSEPFGDRIITQLSDGEQSFKRRYSPEVAHVEPLPTAHRERRSPRTTVCVSVVPGDTSNIVIGVVEDVVFCGPPGRSAGRNGEMSSSSDTLNSQQQQSDKLSNQLKTKKGRLRSLAHECSQYERLLEEKGQALSELESVIAWKEIQSRECELELKKQKDVLEQSEAEWFAKFERMCEERETAWEMRVSNRQKVVEQESADRIMEMQTRILSLAKEKAEEEARRILHNAQEKAQLIVLKAESHQRCIVSALNGSNDSRRDMMMTALTSSDDDSSFHKICQIVRNREMNWKTENQDLLDIIEHVTSNTHTRAATISPPIIRRGITPTISSSSSASACFLSSNLPNTSHENATQLPKNTRTVITSTTTTTTTAATTMSSNSPNTTDAALKQENMELKSALTTYSDQLRCAKRALAGDTEKIRHLGLAASAALLGTHPKISNVNRMANYPLHRTKSTSDVYHKLDDLQDDDEPAIVIGDHPHLSFDGDDEQPQSPSSSKEKGTVPPPVGTSSSSATFSPSVFRLTRNVTVI